MYESLIAKCTELCNADLPTTDNDIKTAVEACMKLREPVLKAKVEAQTELYRRKNQYRHPKDLKEFTDWDRGIMLDDAVREYMMTYETISGLENILIQRIEVLVLLLQTAQGSNS